MSDLSTIRRLCSSIVITFVTATSSCAGTARSAESAAAELRPTGSGCVQLVVSKALVFEGCPSDFANETQVVFQDLENNLYLVYVAKGMVAEGTSSVTTASQGEFELVRTGLGTDFRAERNRRRWPWVLGAIAFVMIANVLIVLWRSRRSPHEREAADLGD